MKIDLKEIIGRVILAIIVIFLLCDSGCSKWSYDRTDYDAKGRVIGEVHASASESFLDSNIDQVKVSVDGTKRTLSIGQVVRDTDEEAVEAVATGVVKGVIGAATP